MDTIGKNIERAAHLLGEGNVVAIPTETVYGLAANALNSDAVVKIFETKNRPAFDPLIVHTHSISEVEKYTSSFPSSAQKLFEAFAPGPLTIILPKSSTIPDIVTSGNDTVGIRIPNHPLTLNLLNSLRFPLAAPSANPFGYVSPTSAQHVFDQLGEKIPYIIDGGNALVGVESTIVKCIDDRVEVLRLGGLEIEEIETILGKKVDKIKTSSSNPQAPGMLSSHYNPGKKVVIGDIATLLKEHKNKKIGILSYYQSFQSDAIVKQIVLSKDKDLSVAARNLFAALRAFDTNEVELVLSETFPDQGLGKAINDRLKRAAATL